MSFLALLVLIGVPGVPYIILLFVWQHSGLFMLQSERFSSGQGTLSSMPLSLSAMFHTIVLDWLTTACEGAGTCMMLMYITASIAYILLWQTSSCSLIWFRWFYYSIIEWLLYDFGANFPVQKHPCINWCGFIFFSVGLQVVLSCYQWSPHNRYPRTIGIWKFCQYLCSEFVKILANPYTVAS